VVFAFDETVPHLFVAAVCAFAAFSQLFAGRAQRLANIDYSRVADPAALNRWAGLRMLVLPVVSLLNAALAGFALVPGVWLWCAFVAAVATVVLWTVLGARRFQRSA
jgi:hypothetical protein